MKNNLLSKRVAKAILGKAFVKVDRTAFLTEILAPYYSKEELAQLPAMRPEQFVSTSILDQLANEVLKEHLTRASLLCSGSSLLGKASLYLSVPADYAIFWGELITMTRKLAYLYGWDSSFFGNEPTEESYARLRLILGYAMGNPDCRFPLFEAACDALPTVKYASPSNSLSFKDPLVRKGALTLCLQLAKALITGATSKKNPILGSGVGAVWSYITFRQNAVRIHALLRETMYYRLEQEVLC